MSDHVPLSSDHQNIVSPAMAYQQASVCVPVQIIPYANTGAVVTECCGTATVSPGIHTCTGNKNGSCYFTMNQKVCIAVPVAFGAAAAVEDTYVNPGESTKQKIIISCNDQ